ncbi:MAG: hypothetical protein IIC50_07425 [Planctomycetes bacterium]|nr:hypothetical protein [Planctomycetota bacterium]
MTTLRARAVGPSEEWTSSDIVTHTYLYLR